MGSFDRISQLPPTPHIRPRTQSLPTRKPRERKPDPRAKRQPALEHEDTDSGLPHIDEYA